MATQWENIEGEGLANIATVKNRLPLAGKLQVRLVRRWFTSNTSIGKLYLNGLLYCYTLEDVSRAAAEPKVYGETAIPYGTYNVLMTVSGIAYKWKTPGNILPLIDKVPGFSGIRIHPGVRKEHTLGCVLVGFTRTLDEIGASQKAFWPLFDLMSYANQQGYPITIEVTNEEKKTASVAALVIFCGVALFLIVRAIIKHYRS